MGIIWAWLECDSPCSQVAETSYEISAMQKKLEALRSSRSVLCRGGVLLGLRTGRALHGLHNAF